jgi:uncharacterized protein
MKKLALSLIVGLVAGSVFAVGQQSDDFAAPDRADVLKFMDCVHLKAQMIQMLEGMTKQVRLGAEQGFKNKVPNATPEQLAKVDQLFDGMFSDLPIDDMIDAIIPIYQKHLTKGDLVAITAFYSSPVGQKVLKEMPAIMSEAMGAGGEIGRKMFSAKSQEFDQRVAALIEAMNKK